jgi:hypothetical protein
MHRAIQLFILGAAFVTVARAQEPGVEMPIPVAQPLPPPQRVAIPADTVYSPPVVLRVLKSAYGKTYVEPQAEVMLTLVEGRPEDHPAPLPDGASMICRQFDLDTTYGHRVAYRCGSDVYVLQAFGFKIKEVTKRKEKTQ